ncbi:MAG: tetratricopeptide repeat protein [Planctomycetes bacterium]|nr:tetratricopeptide repeat protein [Planctomycetota bacterium]
MKHSFAINVGTAIVLLVPAVALQGGDAKSLDDSLRKTMAVLDDLAGVEKRLTDKKDATAVPEIVRLTEAPIGTDIERDKHRDTLRDEVNELQGRLDGMQSGTTVQTPRNADEDVDVEHEHSAPTQPRAVAPKAGRETTVARNAHAAREPAAFETHGYVADSVRLVRAYYKQERFAEALAVLGTSSTDASSNYWRGRCLEKLGKTADALAAYRLAKDAKGGGLDAERAGDAIVFLEWQAKFESRRTETKKP